MNLNTSVDELPLVGPAYQKRLEKLGIFTLKDLLYHLPNRYNDFSLKVDLNQIRVGDIVTVSGILNSLKNQYTRNGKKIQIGEVEDKTGKITVVWFNQTYLVRTLYPGTLLSLSGKIEWFGNKPALISPEYEMIRDNCETVHTGKIVPVYPETQGVSSKWLRAKIKAAYKVCGFQIKEYLSETFGFTPLPDALRAVHFPKSLSEAKAGRTRLAFEELLQLQIRSLKRKAAWQKNQAAFKLKVNSEEILKFYDSLPFKLTSSQEKAIKEILADLGRGYPMNRLLEGDVGSGKTVVAATAAFAAFLNGGQTIIMAPTQILAQQHFNTLNSVLQSFKVRVSLVTSEVKISDLGRSDIFVGTHALIHQKLNLDKVALVIIDEQHKFGVAQREYLVKKSKNKSLAPHVLTLTATPIPRTVALTFYGDLDLSVLNEIPAGRPKIITWIVPPEKREGAYSWIKSQVTQNGSQVFLVCPLIEESDKETMKDVRAVTSEFKKLKSIFPNLDLDLLHGQLKAAEKEKIIHRFRERKTAILVTTPVVEVGLDIPNATIMVVEAAERFGLAQLHQLRGRVGRGFAKSYCLLFSESTPTEKVITRLTALTKNTSGFELAELDLKLRGPGEIFGLRQHGLPDLKIASWQDVTLIKKAKEVAKVLESGHKRKYN